MSPDDLQTLIALHLEHLAKRVEHLYSVGRVEDAEMLRQEGLNLATAYDTEQTFMYV